MKHIDITIGNKIKRINRSEHYRIVGKTFTVEITHNLREYEPYARNEQAWCLYVIIGEEHPLYKKCCENKVDYDLELGNDIYPNWHGGCTFYSKQNTYVKIGCDYQHFGDECLYKNDSEELSNEILTDAKELFDFFSKMEDNQ